MKPKPPVWVLAGAESLQGKEIRESLEQRHLPVQLRLLGAQKETAIITQIEDEPSLIEPVTPEAFDGARVVFLAGTAEQGRAAREAAAKVKARPVWIDVTGALENLPESKLRAPLLEAEAPPAEPGSVHTLAHPAALLIGRFLADLHQRFALRHSVITVFEPASALGQPGIEELHQQTINLFAFHTLPKAVYDTQAAFNLLPRYGEDAPVKLESSESRLERHLVTFLGPRGVPLPSLKLVHAPVFHGYAFQAWIEFNERPTPKALKELFADLAIDVRDADTEPPSNVGIAGQTGLTLEAPREDHNHPRAIWFFGVGDNLQTIATAAIVTASLTSVP